MLAALVHNVLIEIAACLFNFSAAVPNDFGKLCGTSDIPELIQQAVYTEYPLDQKAYALQQHLATRVILAGSLSSESTQFLP